MFTYEHDYVIPLSCTVVQVYRCLEQYPVSCQQIIYSAKMMLVHSIFLAYSLGYQYSRAQRTPEGGSCDAGDLA